MIRLLVSDFDGTLVPYGASKVSAEVKYLLRSAIDRGTVVAVSSGRTYAELAGALPEFAEDIWLVCCDGAYYVKNGRAYYERKIEAEDLRLLEKNCTDGVSMVLHGAFANYSIGRVPDEAARYAATAVDRVEDIKEKIFKVTTYGLKLRLPPYCGLRTHWDGGIHDMAQFVNRFANKGAALSDLQSRLLLTKFETACMGDSGNDIAMMHNAKLALCVGERSDALKKVCTHHVKTPEDAIKIILSS